MWIFFNHAFLSIVEPSPGSPELLVRARIPGDLERVFPGAVVQETPHRDYRFRATLPRATVAQALADAADGLHYSNFKGSVTEADRHDAYLQVWAAMARWQHSRRGHRA